MIGRRTRTAGTLLAASLFLAPHPAQAQVQSFLDGLFGRKAEPAPEPEPAATPAKKPAPKPAKAAEKPVPAKAGEKSADRAGAKAADKPSDKAARSAEPKVAAVATPAPITADANDPATVLAQANAYFNGITTLTGGFTQIGPDGRRIGGKLTLAKPGRLRFDYDAPSPWRWWPTAPPWRCATAS